MGTPRGKAFGVTRTLLAVAAVVALAASACTSDDGGNDGDGAAPEDRTDITTASQGEVQEGGALRFGLLSETSGFNPTADQFGTSGYLIVQAIFDRLMGYDAEGRVEPYLAESMEPNDDFTRWTITLREGVDFHDGTPLDAEALAANLDAHKASLLLSQAFTAMESVEVTGALSVDVIMNTPWSTFPHVLTAQPGYVAAPSQLEDPDGSRNPVGTGPFVFQEWVRDQKLTVTRNEDYWREGFPLLDGIEFQVATDNASRAAALESGDLDIMESTDGAQVAAFEERAADGEYQVFLAEEGETTETVFFVNTATAPFDDPRAREAVAHALDREEISEVVYAGRFAPAQGPFKENSPFHAEVDWPELDPERATELVADYEADTGSPLRFSISSPPDPANQTLVQLLQQQFGDVGMEVDIQPAEATSGALDVIGGDYQAGTSTILFGSTHPDREAIFLDGENALPIGQLGLAFTRVADEQLDAALDEARTTDDPEEQAEQWAIIQERLAERLGFFFLVHDDIAAIATPAVRDVTTWTLPNGDPGLPQEQSVLSLYQIWLER